MKRWIALWMWLTALMAAGEPLAVRVVAANLTSDRHQQWSPDNANHSNPEGAGARILKGLEPDVVMMQEFNTSLPVRQWVNRTLGEEFQVFREEVTGIPNGVISRFPIVSSGSWVDPAVDNRGFAWAELALPGGRKLWVVSVHLHSKGATSRDRSAKELVKRIGERVPEEALLLIGGDFNTRTMEEACFRTLARCVVVPEMMPADHLGNPNTNAPRNRPYDQVLANTDLEKFSVPVKLGGRMYPGGLVFDSRVFKPLDALAPVREGDSGLPMMQHMAVVRDFVLK
ncbi:MAG: endonuclease/exonuclease/phosphatase family protein [Akkermansiaceae bacterium]|nr:endonuclease/exonuclease/phosphatase family protein [Akkermansiaceae bacterium]